MRVATSAVKAVTRYVANDETANSANATIKTFLRPIRSEIGPAKSANTAAAIA